MRKTLTLLAAFGCIQGYAFAGSIAEDATTKGIDLVNSARYDEAITELSNAIDSDPKAALAFYTRGMAHHKKGELDKAVADYTKALELSPKEAEWYYFRGMAYYYKDNLDRAIEDWSNTVELRPKATDAYLKRAFAYYKKRYYDKAWDDVDMVKKAGLKIPPDFLAVLKKDSGREE